MATARILHRKCSPSHGRSQLVPANVTARLSGSTFLSYRAIFCDQCWRSAYISGTAVSTPPSRHAKKTAEIDHGGPYLPGLIDQHIDDPAQVFPGAAADLLAKHPHDVLVRQDRLPGVLVVVGIGGGGR